DVVLAGVALATLARRRPDPGQLVDPFDLPTAWRPGEPAWTTWRLRVADDAPVDVRVRPLEGDEAEVAIGGPAPRPAGVHLDGDRLQVTLDGRRHELVVALAADHAWVAVDGDTWLVREEDPLAAHRHDDVDASGVLTAPMPGTVVAVDAAVGAAVARGQTLVVVEAMKMEHALVAPFDGTVAAVHVTAGQQVAMQAPLVEVVAAPDREEGR